MKSARYVSPPPNAFNASWAGSDCSNDAICAPKKFLLTCIRMHLSSSCPPCFAPACACRPLQFGALCMLGKTLEMPRM